MLLLIDIKKPGRVKEGKDMCVQNIYRKTSS